MKALTNCCGAITPAYKTPWCDLLGDCDIESKNILHLYYPLLIIQNEIEKRSSYLGKFRRTDEAKHLLDLIAMTVDEENLFYPFAKAAMADVFDALQLYAPKTQKSYLWREGKDTISIKDISEYTDFLYLDGLDEVLNDDNEIEFSYNLEGKGDPNEVYELLKNEIGFNIYFNITYIIAYKILATNQEIRRTETKLLKADFDIGDINSQTGEWQRRPLAHLYYRPELAAASEFTSAEYLVDYGYIAENAQVLFSPYFLEPQEYKAGDYVLLKDKLYIASADGNANNLEPLVEQEVDYRESIHYILAFNKNWNMNLVEPLDTAIFEALVARIIYKWLQYSYPDEAARYLSEWEEYLKQISRRCSAIWGTKIVSRIPRIY